MLQILHIQSSTLPGEKVLHPNPNSKSTRRDSFFVEGDSQWSFLVPLIGGRYHIITQLAIYKWYISGIHCQEGDYMVPWYLPRIKGTRNNH